MTIDAELNRKFPLGGGIADCSKQNIARFT